MSWPSFYGYKYTPIGLRQRDVIEETGNRTVSTTVHLPQVNIRNSGINYITNYKTRLTNFR